MAAKSPAPTWLDYFSGGVPSGEYFRMVVSDLRNLIQEGPKRERRVCALAVIGLVAYFEAFCKDHFASAVNIVPSLARNLAARGQQTLIDVALVAEDPGVISHQMGFYLADSYDFGTSKKINSTFNALLMISPFSKSDAEVFDRLLQDRNLLVHHGGTFTPSYLRTAKASPGSARTPKPFWDGLAVGPDQFTAYADLAERIAKKLLQSSHTATLKFVREQGLRLGRERKKALDAFLWWGDDEG
jgi:hypothetical protein